MNMQILTLHRGDEKAIVEAGSPAEATMKALGFAELEPEKAKGEPKGEKKPEKAKGEK